MYSTRSTSYTKMNWQEVKQDMYEVHPAFATVIDQLAEKDDFPLYKVRYAFGDHILVQGQFYFPLNEKTLLPITDKRLPADIRDDLEYHAGNIPLGLVLKKSAELFMLSDERVIPLHLFNPGKFIGLLPALSMPYTFTQVWHMTAGARSIFMLPKITDSTNFRKLCRARDIKMPLMRDLSTHWSLFTKIAKHANFSESWSTELILFSKRWINNQSKKWLPFNYFLYQSGWGTAELLLKKAIYDHIWDCLVKELMKENIKVNAFILDIAKYVLMIGLGAVPGFCPATDSIAAPVKGLQEDFIKLYGLKNYAPTIMVPEHFKDRPVYWSIAMPCHFESTIKPKNLTSTLSVLREIRELMLSFTQTIENKFGVMTDIHLQRFLKEVKFDCFHSEPDLEGQIQLSLEMPKGDSSLILSTIEPGKRTFSDVSPFVRGCVRFSIK